MDLKMDKSSYLEGVLNLEMPVLLLMHIGLLLDSQQATVMQYSVQSYLHQRHFQWKKDLGLTYFPNVLTSLQSTNKRTMDLGNISQVDQDAPSEALSFHAIFLLVT